MREHFAAPWSTRLKTTPVVFVGILLVAAYAARGWASLLILAIFLVAAAFAIRGYSIHQGKLLIHRLGWATTYDLASLVSAEVSPGATIGSIRAMGIGGLFGFVGHFHNAVLGSYKAYATNELNTVVLDLAGDRIVVTPDDPHEFVAAVQAAHDSLQSRPAGETWSEGDAHPDRR
jgi:hypothetical protein